MSRKVDECKPLSGGCGRGEGGGGGGDGDGGRGGEGGGDRGSSVWLVSASHGGDLLRWSVDMADILGDGAGGGGRGSHSLALELNLSNSTTHS